MAKFKFNPITGLLDLVEDADTLGLASTDSPTFETVMLTDLSSGYIPYHVSDTDGLSNGPLLTDVNNAISLAHAPGSGGDFLIIQVFS